MRRTKYIMSEGLAFYENKDMEKLRQYSLKGWHVSDFKFMGYTLEKGESTDYIYSIDYRSLQKEEKEEYFDFFSSTGWMHVASEGDIHLFRAYPCTKPIYTDSATTVEKYKNSSDSLKKSAIPCILITILLWAGAMITSSTLKSILLVLAVILTVIAIPTAMTVAVAFNTKWKIEGKRGLVNLVKVVPFFLLFTAIIILLFVEGTSDTVYILTSMLIGAIALPTIIWVIMSLYYKVSGKQE